MSLEQIKEQLKRKPRATKYSEVFVNIEVAREQGNDGSDLIVDREDIMKRLKKRGLVKVVEQGEQPSFSREDILDDEEELNNASSAKKDMMKRLTSKKRIELKDVTQLKGDDEHRDITQSTVRKTNPLVKGVAELPIEKWVDVKNQPVIDRLPPPLPMPTLRVSGFYLNNRKKFVNFINSYFKEYREEILNDEISISCDDIGKDDNPEFKLLIHQRIVRDYLNLYSPYRGLLLYHGLGSGKTCSSIAIAEGMKSSKKVIIMTPASLKRNYIEEIKKCGDTLYKKEQYWEWVPLNANSNTLDTLSTALGITVAYLKKKKGVWMVDHKKDNNLDKLSAKQIMSIDEQLDEMIKTKYQFINYNGLRREKLKSMTDNYKNNIFDHSVVVIDEVHNFISRISNKIDKEKPVNHDKDGDPEKFPISLALVLYEMLMNAEDIRIVFLTGTPIINYPNEIGILYNMLRGYIKTWNFTLKTNEGYNTVKSKLENVIGRDRHMDYFEYSKNNVLSITRNPLGFERSSVKGQYVGVKDTITNERGEISDEDFKRRIMSILENNDLQVERGTVKINVYKALPDTLKEFETMFLGDNGIVKNADLFKKRILGLTSYFRSAQEGLLPRYEPISDFKVIKIPMSEYQIGLYETARSAERKEDLKRRSKKAGVDKDGLYAEPTSSYRIFSRLYCNFVMPNPPGRPLPNDGNMGDSYRKTLAETDKKGSNDLEETEGNDIEGDVMISKNADSTYNERIQGAIKYLKEHENEVFSREALEIYSPKFLHILENITDKEHVGLHLLYSQFRTLEGIGLFKMVLDYNGYTQFKIKKGSDGVWHLDIAEEDRGKPTYALYTGTESSEEKEIIRNIYNSNWDPNLPITQTLREIANNNHMGEIIKVLMITASGSEGINLRSTRYVHIMEPYWHPTRKDQVIGRARRICSHKALPEEYQDVTVFLYLMTITPEQEADISKDTKLHDKSKLKYPTDGENSKMEYRLVTSDEALFEISTIKERITSNITRVIKEAAIDCATYSRRGNKEQLECVQYGEPRVSEISFTPDIAKQPTGAFENKNKITKKWEGRPYYYEGKTYIHRQMGPDNANLYDAESYYQSLENPNIEPQLIATEEKKGNKYIVKSVM
uniref:Helicase ATP-binding domain-containing protein n=1 Tax=viral metagenome TaxID=1070528 RepID=A0A6C0IL01_9ZZZZ